MPVPKKRRSKSKSRIKKAAWSIFTPALRVCDHCSVLTVSHRSCTACGYYKGKLVSPRKEKSPKSDS